MMADLDGWQARMEAERAEKDQFFTMHPQSPIPVDERANFKGLNYFPIDPAYRFELQLYDHEPKVVIKMGDSSGNVRRLWRGGEFLFELEGKQCALQAYKDSPEEQRMFVPFRDKTSGEQTYGAGRYLDLEPERHLTAAGKWTVDFNEAYNPWCAYSKDYVCPLVPVENWLKVPVCAGEKNYSLSKK